jgi:hypothetical protein
MISPLEKLQNVIRTTLRLGGLPQDKADQIVIFPPPLSAQLLVTYYREYIRFLRMPVIWVTIFVYAVILVGICYFQSAWAFVLHWFLASMVVGGVTILHIFKFWHLVHRWGLRSQIIVLNLTLGLLINTLAWGMYISLTCPGKTGPV